MDRRTLSLAWGIVLGGLWIAVLAESASSNFPASIDLRGAELSASSSAPGYDPRGPADGQRFSAGPGHAWQGLAGQSNWWWQVRFAEPRQVGAILQIIGDHPFILRDAPRDYVWQSSQDGELWEGSFIDRDFEGAARFSPATGNSIDNEIGDLLTTAHTPENVCPNNAGSASSLSR